MPNARPIAAPSRWRWKHNSAEPRLEPRPSALFAHQERSEESASGAADGLPSASSSLSAFARRAPVAASVSGGVRAAEQLRARAGGATLGPGQPPGRFTKVLGHQAPLLPPTEGGRKATSAIKSIMAWVVGRVEPKREGDEGRNAESDEPPLAPRLPAVMA